jgi:hypothetical protein
LNYLSSKTLEAKLACSDTAVIDNKILNNEIDKLEKELEQIYEQKAKGAQISASHNSLQFFKSLLILAEYFNIMSFILS